MTVTLLALVCIPTHAATGEVADLADLSLEQLGNIIVTSVSRREEPLADAPASIFVITADDIRRSGAASLPEALRLAPNLEVARADANQYAISARGFNNTLANKMLVLIDGRTVYTPLFSGVFWEAQEVMLEDVDRIEVISGPGTTLWGANAVNGVINVITRSAKDTQGALIAAGGGNRERGADVRYGGSLSAAGHYRLYGMYVDRSNTERAGGTPIRDASNKGQVGFRADWESATFQGDAYSGRIDQQPAGREISGVNLLGRWQRSLGNESGIRLQAYYDHTERFQPATFKEQLDTFDLEFQHALRPSPRQTLVWGAGYRYALDRVENSAPLAFLPPDRDLRWANVFVQDQIALRNDLDLVAGVKVETNSYTGAELLPNLRLGWRPGRNRFVWGAVSRAVRAPSRIDRDFFIPANPPFMLAGGPEFESEVADVFELGYRAQPSTALSYSVTAFHGRYERLRSLEPEPGGAQLENKIRGTNTGVEGWATWRPASIWRLSGGLVVMHEELELQADSRDIGGLAALGNDPSHWWSLRSGLDITPRLELDVMLRRVGALPNPSVPAYTAVDLRLGWRPTGQVEVSLTLQNLFDPGHAEWGAPANRAEYDRSVFLKLVLAL
jgi:iron complex outermembrane recepter protein